MSGADYRLMAAACRIDVKKYKAVLFDLDGVIMDTMPLHYEAWRQAFAKYGVPVAPREIYELEGMPSRELGKALVKRKGGPLPEEQVMKAVEDKREIFRSLAAKQAMMFPGVPETLTMLRKNGIRLALVTGSNLKTVNELLRKAGLESAFEIVVSGDDTARGKPYPDPYLKGMEILGMPPANCVVVENAPLGLASAKAADVGYVIGVTTTLPADYLKGADDIMTSFVDLEECLARRLSKA